MKSRIWILHLVIRGKVQWKCLVTRVSAKGSSEYSGKYIYTVLNVKSVTNMSNILGKSDNIFQVVTPGHTCSFSSCSLYDLDLITHRRTGYVLKSFVHSVMVALILPGYVTVFDRIKYFFTILSLSGLYNLTLCFCVVTSIY